MAKLCKKCGAELDQLTGKCPACGTEEQSASPKKRSRAALWAAVCLLLAVVGVGILTHLGIVDIPSAGKQAEQPDIPPQTTAEDGNQGAADTKKVRRLTRMDSYDESDALQWYHTYTYDAKGEMTGVTSYDGQGNQTGHAALSAEIGYWYPNCTGVVTPRGRTMVTENNAETVTDENGYREVYELDANGRREKQYQYPRGEESFFAYAVYAYDDDGLLTRVDTYLPDDTLSGYVAYQYNAAGKPLKETACLADGTVVSDSSAVYNEYGELARKHYYTSTGRLESYHMYEYAAIDETA